MNITPTSRQLEGLAFGTAARNAANPGSNSMTEEQFAADLLGVKLDAYADERESAIRAALAENEELVKIGQEVAAATPEKQALAIAAAREVLAA